jgi:hypothetical protein
VLSIVESATDEPKRVNPVAKSNDNDSFRLSTITSLDNDVTRRTPLNSTRMKTNNDLYLGWTLFKGANRHELGLREEMPRIIQVKHQANTYVIGIPEQYANDRSKGKTNNRTIVFIVVSLDTALRLYRGETVRSPLSTTRPITNMIDHVCQCIRLPTLTDATVHLTSFVSCASCLDFS